MATNNMEEMETLPIETEVSPIKICRTTFRIRRPQLVMQELTQICALVMALLIVVGICVIYSRPSSTYDGVDIRWLTVVACFSLCVQHCFTFVNLRSAGWGSANGQFWCDVKIMMVRGFNTIRSISRMVSVPVLYVQMAYLLGCSCPSTRMLVVMLALLGEYQAVISENQNQYDVQTHEKFVSDDNFLLLEQVHKYQSEHPLTKVKHTPFVLHAVLNLYLATCLMMFKTVVPHPIFFATPVIVLLMTYTVCIPIMTHLLYLKGVWTFCELDIYRSISDVVLIVLLTLFTLI
jgi:hypothetical protein